MDAVRGLVLVAILALTGCAGSIFNTEPYSDTQKDAQGETTLRDTPRMWAYSVSVTDMQVASERNGEHAPGVATWNEHWLLRIRANQSSQENASKYISYMVDARRKAGLPELIGYP
jgi:hypothetical protein